MLVGELMNPLDVRQEPLLQCVELLRCWLAP